MVGLPVTSVGMGAHPSTPTPRQNKKQVNGILVRQFVQHVREHFQVPASTPSSGGRHIAIFSRTRNRHILNEVEALASEPRLCERAAWPLHL